MQSHYHMKAAHLTTPADILGIDAIKGHQSGGLQGDHQGKANCNKLVEKAA